MRTKVIKKGSFCYILIKNFFSKKALIEIYDEIDHLKNVSEPPFQTRSAVDINNAYLKTGSGIFLDELYLENRENSSILVNCRQLFNNPKIGEKAVLKDANFGHINNSNKDFTLVNFYASGQEYKWHTDLSVITAITFLKIGNFTGGEFCFPEYNELIPFEENLMVVFPGCVKHQAKPIYGNKDSYRISIAQFLNYK